jgi:hypothetical protein
VDRRARILRINTSRYTVVPLPNGFRLVNWSSGKMYDIEAESQSCTCPSFVWDHCPVQAGGDGRCKHIAALRTLGVLPEVQAAEPDLPVPDCVIEP